MAVPYIDTPRSDVDRTILPRLDSIVNMSPEKSFQSPSNDYDLLKGLQGERPNFNLRTPRPRSAQSRKGEFTPLMKSVTRSNLMRSTSRNDVPKTPAFLKPGYRSAQNTPALPTVDISALYEHTASSAGDEPTPIPQAASSSAPSTPLATLPRRNGEGALAEGGNRLTLKEQEKIIDRIEKDNFGLKLKIHYLEDSLKKMGPEFNSAALKENTELKVSQVTIERELHRYKKRFALAEREIEKYRMDLSELQKDTNRKNADEALREETEWLRQEILKKDAAAEEYLQKVEAMKNSQKKQIDELLDDNEDKREDIKELNEKIANLEDQVEALEEKLGEAEPSETMQNDLHDAHERIVELERALKNAESDRDAQRQAADKSEEKLEEMFDQIEELKNQVGRDSNQTSKANAALEKLAEEKRRVDIENEKLQKELASGSSASQGLSQRLEDKVSKLNVDLESVQRQYAELQERFRNKSLDADKLHQQFQDLKQENENQERRFQNEIESARHERDMAKQAQSPLKRRAEATAQDLLSRTEEKDLLQSRHDALTSESQGLQRELFNAKTIIKQLEASVENERRHAIDNDKQLREQAEHEISQLHDEIDALQRQLEDKENQAAAGHEQWDSQRRQLEAQKQKAEEQAAGLKQTIAKLRLTEGTLSGREKQLSEALESEKKRHEREEAVTAHQIKELQSDIDSRRQALEEVNAELSATREELRISKRSEAELKENVQALDDDLQVLQDGIDDEVDQAKAELEDHIAELEEMLKKVKSEKYDLEKELNNVDRDVRSLRLSVAEIESERNDLQDELKRLQEQAGSNMKLDDEKMSLKKSKLKLEGEVTTLEEEKKALLERSETLEKNLEKEIKERGEEEARLQTQVTDFKQKLAVASEARDREYVVSKNKIKRLEARVEELETAVHNGTGDEHVSGEMSMIKSDLESLRKKEAEYIQHESSYKENIRTLKQQILELERQLHELQMKDLTVDVASPKSTGSSQSRTSELLEARRQLAEASQQMRELRSKARESERENHRKLLALEQEAQQKVELLAEAQESLEQEITDIRRQQEDELAKNANAEQTISRLRAKIQRLEQDLRNARAADRTDATIASERRDLHEMLQDAKLEAEDLQLQIADRDEQIQAAQSHEADIKAKLKRVRDERGYQIQKTRVVTSELHELQQSYDALTENYASAQASWEEEKQTILQRVRFPNTSISTVHQHGDSDGASQLADLERQMDKQQRQHMAELKGLAKQIKYLRAKVTREAGFRSDLAYEKRFLLMQIAMFGACNAADLKLLQSMGITPPPRDAATAGRPRFKSVACVVVATLRMQRKQKDWDANKRVHAQMVRKVEGMRSKARKHE